MNRMCPARHAAGTHVARTLVSNEASRATGRLQRSARRLGHGRGRRRARTEERGARLCLEVPHLHLLVLAHGVERFRGRLEVQRAHHARVPARASGAGVDCTQSSRRHVGRQRQAHVQQQLGNMQSGAQKDKRARPPYRIESALGTARGRRSAHPMSTCIRASVCTFQTLILASAQAP